MNDDELAIAREAVAATKAWRDQMRADWGVGFREPEEVLDQAVGELLAERDRLRAVVDAVHRGLYRGIEPDAPDADQIATLPSAVAGIIAGQGQRLDDAEAERDRLRAVVDAVRHFIALQVTDGHPAEDDAAAWERMIASLEQLDVSAEATDG